jgi:hypothetical protein
VNYPGTYSQWVGSSQPNFDLKNMVLTTSKGFFMEEMAQISQIWLHHKIGKKYSGLILMMDSLYELVACGDMLLSCA